MSFSCPLFCPYYLYRTKLMYDIQQQTAEILLLLEKHNRGLSRGEISKNLGFPINDKLLQRRLIYLIETGKIFKTGNKKGTRYFIAKPFQDNKGQINHNKSFIFTPRSQEVLKFLDTPAYLREKKSYNRDFLDKYVPNQTVYIPLYLRKQLFQAGKRLDSQLVAGTYARHICQRLLIDLSYNSSRLEGNTYSLLDTQKLLEDGISADGKIHEDAVMILNHKEAILFLVENAQEVTLNTITVRNLHQLLSQDLISNPASCGNVRSIEVSIGRSSYKPLDNQHLLKELLELILYKAQKIDNPFEQSLFLLIHLSYLQAFEDVNKRTSRLSCNIPFIKNNLCPLSFTDVSQDDYIASLLCVYEKNDITPMIDLFVWAYLRSCEQYSIVKQSLGEIDTYRIKYRQQRKIIMGQIIQQNLHGNEILQAIEAYCHEQDITDVSKFVAMTLVDLDTLHLGAIIGLGVTETQFQNWLSNKP